jgi:hypothetical protein
MCALGKSLHSGTFCVALLTAFLDSVRSGHLFNRTAHVPILIHVLSVFSIEKQVFLSASSRCPDCESAEPVIDAALASIGEPVTMLYCPVVRARFELSLRAYAIIRVMRSFVLLPRSVFVANNVLLS